MEATGDSPETRVPWINTQTQHDAEDHRGLIEYLAAPCDPSKDSHKQNLMLPCAMNTGVMDVSD